jgi:probable HAF family extracellular repeat protein
LINGQCAFDLQCTAVCIKNDAAVYRAGEDDCTMAINKSPYTFSTFDVPGYSGTFLSGINNSGQVVGGYGFDTPNFGSQAFIATHGNIATINMPGSFVNGALGINNTGQVVGSYLANSQGNIAWQGFVDTNGTFTSINVPGADATMAFGINNLGQVVGNSINYSTNVSNGFVDTNGIFTSINVPGAYGTAPLAINDSGQIVGLYQNVSLGPGYGFIDTNGSFTSISVPGASYTVPEGINDSGQIVGYFLGASGYQNAFVDTDGTFTIFDLPGATDTAFFGINNLGEVVGGYVDETGVEHGFVGTPVTVAPTIAIVSIDNTDVNVANGTGTVTFAFSEAPVTFVLADTSAVGGTLSNLQQTDATHYTATFTGAANTDIANASVSETAGSYQDAAGNAGTGGSTAPFTVDTVTPTVAVSIDNTAVNVANPTGLVTFTFNKAPTDFSLNDVTATDGSLSSFSGSGTTYTATFTANAGVDDNAATVSVINGSFHDADGNAGTGAASAMSPVQQCSCDVL